MRRPGSSAAGLEKFEIARLTHAGNVSRAAISPNGHYIAYVAGARGEQNVRLRLATANSETELLRRAPAFFMGITFSTDSNYLYYVLEGAGGQPNSLYRMAVLGGAPEKVKEGIHSPISFSPDGKRFAFIREYTATAESVLLIAEADGPGERRIISRKSPEYLDYPAWSPDGQTILCVARSVKPGDARAISVRASEGQESPAVSGKWWFIWDLAWLPTGGFVMNARASGSLLRQIWQVDTPGGAARLVTNDLDSYEGVSVPTRLGSLVSVQSKTISGIFVGPAEDATQARQIETSAQRHFGLYWSGLSWTESGMIVYHKGVGTDSHIWIISQDGTGSRQLTHKSANTYPAVCGNDNFIVYTSDHGGGWGVWRMGLDGSNPKGLTSGTGPTRPACSPDGKWVVFTSHAGKWPTLWKVSAEGGKPSQLSDGRAATPVISPDGQWVAAYYSPAPATLQNPPENIAIFSMNGGSPRKLFRVSQTTERDANLQWTSDGKGIGYIDLRNGVSNVWVQPVSGDPPRQVTNFAADQIFSFSWSRDGTQLCLTRGLRTQDIILIQGVH